jgi:hypothetical protein
VRLVSKVIFGPMPKSAVSIGTFAPDGGRRFRLCQMTLSAHLLVPRVLQFASYDKELPETRLAFVRAAMNRSRGGEWPRGRGKTHWICSAPGRKRA